MPQISIKMTSDIAISSFWGAVIPPKSSYLLDFPPETLLRITSFSFGEVSSDEPSKISIHVRTLLIEDEKCVNGDECEVENKQEIVVGSLIPKKAEQIPVALTFSPLDIIQVFNDGPNEVHLSGFLQPLEDDILFLEEEEEEEAHEDLSQVNVDPDEIQGRFAKMASNQPPIPEPKGKGQKAVKEEQNDVPEEE